MEIRESVLLGLGRRVGRLEEMVDHPPGSLKAPYLAIAWSRCGKKGPVSHLADIFRETMKIGLLRREGMAGGKKLGKGGGMESCTASGRKSTTRRTITAPSKGIWKMSKVCAVIERGFAQLDGL